MNRRQRRKHRVDRSSGVPFVTDDPIAVAPDPAGGFIEVTPEVLASISASIDARRARGEFNEGGELLGDGYRIEVRGNCPVQGEGFVDRLPAYFRARHSSWRFSIAGEPGGDPVAVGFEGGPPGFTHGEEWPGGEHSAGWMNFEQAAECIRKAIAVYRKSVAP